MELRFVRLLINFDTGRGGSIELELLLESST